MTSRIDSIYYYNYTKDFGFYHSIRDFSLEEMSYIGLALSTPKISVNSTPDSFDIPPEGSEKIRKYVISKLNTLQEISKDLAINSPKYILICYFDGTERYFEYSETFCAFFRIAVQYKPRKEAEETQKSPIALQNDNSLSALSYTKSSPTSAQTASYAPSSACHQPSNATKYTPVAKKKTFHWGKLIAGIIFLILIFAPLISVIFDDTDSDLTPVSEPRSGAILSGREGYDGSELTITASGGEACVVKLKTASGVERMSFYVRAGDTVTVGVPAEYLYVYFASGDTWYGMTYLFGERTSYSMDDDLRDFTEYTWEYTLYPVTNGNFSETPIDASDFN